MASSRTLEDLDLSKDEIKRLGESLKDEQFRKMLVEYAEEISNPENRRKAEQEITIMENERGMSVQFIHPEPGYVLKTTIDGSKKAFINICQNNKIEQPKAKKQVGPDGKRGVMWQIPHSFAPPRDDYDKTQQVCKVFDVVFHPDTYRMAMSNERFKKLVEDTAVDGIESQFGVTLDKKNVRRPKMKFKGLPQPTVIRERLAHQNVKENSDHGDPDILSQMPYPYNNKTSSEKSKENEMKHAKKKAEISKEKVKTEDNKFTQPKYTITHLSEVDMSEYRNAPDAKTSTCPKKLVIKIELPLLNSASQASLDIFEKKLILESVSPAAYKLDLSLPYQVNEDEGSAKFDKSKRTLTVTLPVIPPKTPPLPFSVEMESDNNKSGHVNSSTLIECLPVNAITDTGVDVCLVSEGPVQVGEAQTGVLQATEHESEDLTSYKNTKFPQNMKWILPSHQFSQDIETVSFVINIKNIEENSVEMSFPGISSVMVHFLSIGAGCFPVYYKLFVQFPDECTVSSDHCSIDVSDNNLVFVILKDKKCRGLWDSFRIGVSDTELEERQFLTESNLQKELSDLDKEALEESNMPSEVETPVLSVVEMTEKQLTIDIKSPKSKKWKLPETTEEDDEEYSPPSSADIEVVHKHPPPDLHSILKQRTMSESSEEVSSVDPDSPRSEGEELSSSFSKKRSVSFSSHVDHASFKSSASVSSMTPALKSKRRRQRRREEKRRGRCSSESTSSSEEYLQSMFDSCCQSEEEGDSANKKYKSGRRVVLNRTMSDPGPSIGGLSTITEVERGSGEPGKKSKRKHKNTNMHALVTEFKKDFDIRTKKLDKIELVSVNVSKAESDCGVKGSVNMEGDGDKINNVNKEKLVTKENTNKNKKIISEIKSKLAEENTGKKNGQREDSDDDDDFEDAVSSLIEDFNTKANCGEETFSAVSTEQEHVSEGTREESYSKHIKKDKTNVIEEIEPVAEKEVNKGVEVGSLKDRSKSNASGNGCSEKERSDVETMLSWEEGEVNGEHVTVCELQFSNSLMFDLDIE